jgi:transposase-like protein
MNRQTKFSPELRERAIRMVYEQREHHESQWAAIESVAQKIGCTAQTLRNWIAKGEAKAKAGAGDAASSPRVKELEREVRELKRANEILKLASAFFAQAELDRRLK